MDNLDCSKNGFSFLSGKFLLWQVFFEIWEFLGKADSFSTKTKVHLTSNLWQTKFLTGSEVL